MFLHAHKILIYYYVDKIPWFIISVTIPEWLYVEMTDITWCTESENAIHTGPMG